MKYYNFKKDSPLHWVLWYDFQAHLGGELGAIPKSDADAVKLWIYENYDILPNNLLVEDWPGIAYANCLTFSITFDDEADEALFLLKCVVEQE